MKAVGIASEADLPLLDEAARVADQILVDAKPPPGRVLPGGNGLAFDWRLLAGRRWPVPWMLAGGLTPGNVAEAIRLTGARQVDVSSGVESAPGRKDRHPPSRAFLAGCTMRFRDAVRERCRAPSWRSLRDDAAWPARESERAGALPRRRSTGWRRNDDARARRGRHRWRCGGLLPADFPRRVVAASGPPRADRGRARCSALRGRGIRGAPMADAERAPAPAGCR